MRLLRRMGLRRGGGLPPSPAPAYYVDSVLGDDGNDGLSPEQVPDTTNGPVKTVAGWVALDTENPLSRVYFARGGTGGDDTPRVWREQLQPPRALTVAAYGAPDTAAVDELGSPLDAGNKPMFDCRDVAGNGDFSKTDGRDNVYEIAWTHSLVTNGASLHSVWEDGVRLTRAASLDACDETPGSFFAAVPSSSTSTIYVHPNDSTDPTSDAKEYQITRRNYGYIDGTGSANLQGGTVRGIATIGNGHNDGSLLASRAFDCIALDGTKHNFWNGGYAERCSAIGADLNTPQGGTLFIHFRTGATTFPGAHYKRCLASANPGGTTGAANFTGYYWHAAGGAAEDAFQSMILDECHAETCAIGAGGTQAKKVLYLNCTSRYTDVPLARGGDAYVLGGRYDTTHLSGATALFFDRITGVGTLVLRGVTVLTDDGPNGLIRWNSTPAVTPVRVDIRYCTFRGDGNSRFMLSSVNVPVELSLQNTIVTNGGSTWLYTLNSATGVTLVDVDNNVYGNPAWDVAVNSVTTYTSLADYFAGVAPKEANSYAGDPLFANLITDADPTALQEGSPAIVRQAGVTFCPPSEIAAKLAEYYAL